MIRTGLFVTAFFLTPRFWKPSLGNLFFKSHGISHTTEYNAIFKKGKKKRSSNYVLIYEYKPTTKKSRCRRLYVILDQRLTQELAPE